MGLIFVIDDEPNLRLILDLALSGAGHKVVTAENGLEGLKKLEDGLNPDLVLVDLKMPQLTGKDFIVKMRSCSYYSNTPVVILSGSMPGFGDFPPQECYQAVLPKPFDLNEVIQLVESI